MDVLQIGALEMPGATIAALLIAAALRWAYRGGDIRAWPMTGLVVALAAFVVWRILRLQDGVLTVLDAVAGILCGLLLWSALKAAWADGPFERMPKGRENTPMFVLIVAGAIAFGAVAFSAYSLTMGPRLPEVGLRVETLPPGNWQ